ncbi:unnamed protein product, partial [Meganyctiphanes norvegica]
MDTKNVEETFEMLGYSVKCHENFSSKQMESELNAIVSDQSLWYLDSLIIIIGTHGTERTKFYTSDSRGNTLDITWVRKFFSNKNCPSMKNKPKILIGNFCRGKFYESDALVYQIKQKLSHMITLFSCTEDTVSLRNTSSGSCFITTLCNTLKNNQEEELSVIMNITAKDLEDQKKHCPHPTSYVEHPFCKFVFKCQ